MAELAEKFSLDGLEATVERYNGFCDQGVDSDFGKDAAFLKPVRTAPFYAFEYVPSAWGTNGGVKVDSHLRAMDTSNNPIRGLYVAGVDQGSAYCVPYYKNPGASVGLALGSGVKGFQRPCRAALPSGPIERPYRVAEPNGPIERPCRVAEPNGPSEWSGRVVLPNGFAERTCRMAKPNGPY